MPKLSELKKICKSNIGPWIDMPVSVPLRLIALLEQARDALEWYEGCILSDDDERAQRALKAIAAYENKTRR